ncbi:hypothetical protein [Solimonas variicoloris]|uniref:hypothetical protein n=1 Tax=Solimonas variicoloris TaxID=254408 RepID=UPI00036DD9A7|nr:hypothetical protein [Solimonas variicoloris]
MPVFSNAGRAPARGSFAPRIHFAATVLLAAVLAACGSGSDPATEDNPLAADAQRALDARAIAIRDSSDFAVAKGLAKSQYQIAHGLPISDEAAARLDAAIDELAFSAIQKAVNDDALRPQVYWVNNAAPKTWFGLQVPGGRYSYDNPDNIYRTIPIDGGERYVLRGHRHAHGPADVTFSLISNPNSQNTIDYINGPDLAIDADGDYTITIDADPANGCVNHIQSDASARQLFVRNNLGDWSRDTPDTLTVERLGPAPGAAAPSDDDIRATATQNLLESGFFYGIGALGIKTMVNPVNTLPSPQQSSTLGTLVTQASSFGHFSLDDDEALVITLQDGGAGYFVVPVTDPWLVTADPVGHQSSLNNRQAVADLDGRYTFVVSIADPGVQNWLDPVGLHEGTIMVRWQNLPAEAPARGGPAVEARVVKLADLDSVLPAGTRRVSAAERTRQLQARRNGYERRIAVP